MLSSIEYSSSLMFRPAIAATLFFTTLGIGYLIWSVLYNLLFSPLRHFPGPKLWAISSIPWARMYATGQSHRKILELHKQYGDAIRVGPNDVSFLDPKAWNDVMGHRRSGQGENGKDPEFYDKASEAIMGADRESHTRFRRLLSHGFSAQSMLDQQPLIRQYVDMLFQRLHENCDGGSRPLNMVAWYNYTSFDIIGDLIFGESFDCLKTSGYHPWVALISGTMKQSAQMFALGRVSFWLKSLVKTLAKIMMKYQLEQHMQMIEMKLKKRLALGMHRPDFTEAMIRKEGPMELTYDEIQNNAMVLMIAGSETTGTALAGATFLLLTHPDALAKLTNEVRTNYRSEEEIDMVSVQQLKYMLAVLDETLRIYPPVPTMLPRLTKLEGDVVCGKFVPGGTRLGIWPWPMSHNPDNFSLPDEFLPERWLGDERFAKDKREASQPFSFGARNCIGRNLAYAEMRMILARLVWSFDLRISEDSLDWMERNTTYNLWEKPALNVYLTPRKM